MKRILLTFVVLGGLSGLSSADTMVVSASQSAQLNAYVNGAEDSKNKNNTFASLENFTLDDFSTDIGGDGVLDNEIARASQNITTLDVGSDSLSLLLRLDADATSTSSRGGEGRPPSASADNVFVLDFTIASESLLTYSGSVDDGLFGRFSLEGDDLILPGVTSLAPGTYSLMASVNVSASPLGASNQAGFAEVSLDLVPAPMSEVPEPSTIASLLLMGLTGVGLAWFRRKRT